MGQFAAGDWALSLEDLEFLGTLPAKICVEAALQLCSVRLSGRFIDGRDCLNVISFELCVLTQLRDRIRAKEIWVDGADCYRNPDEDLPKDFAENRGIYYAGLKLPEDAREFSQSVREQLEQSCSS